MKLGLISDTHGDLHPRVLTLFDGVEAIVHAGDVGHRDVLVELETVAPVTAVRGNCDRSPLFDMLPDVAELTTPYGLLVVTHRPPRGVPPFPGLHQDPPPAVIVFGHTHFPKVLDDAGFLLLNPGSASHGRGAPPTVAIADFLAGRLPEVTFYCLRTGDVFPVSLTQRHIHGPGSGAWRMPDTGDDD